MRRLLVLFAPSAVVAACASLDGLSGGDAPDAAADASAERAVVDTSPIRDATAATPADVTTEATTPTNDGGATEDADAGPPFAQPTVLEVGVDDPATCASVEYPGPEGGAPPRVTYCWGAEDPDQPLTVGLGSGKRIGGFATPTTTTGDPLFFDAFSGAGGWFLARLTGKSVWSWGTNDLGQAGADGGDLAPATVQAGGGPIDALIAAGRTHGCAATPTRMYCWGVDDRCQVSGDSSSFTCGTATRKTPTDMVSNLLGADRRYDAIAAGDAHTCVAHHSAAAPQSGVVTCFGDNMFGQLGGQAGSGVGLRYPALPSAGPSEIQIATGEAHTCAIMKDKLYCWGRNSQRQVDVSSTSSFVDFPVSVSNSALGGTPTRLALAGNATCVLVAPTPLGKKSFITCTGSGELGRDLDAGMGFAGEVADISDVTRVALSRTHGCAIADGPEGKGLYCWGSNLNHQVDPTSSTQRFERPHRVRFPRPTK